jgi:hypothetical protein
MNLTWFGSNPTAATADLVLLNKTVLDSEAQEKELWIRNNGTMDGSSAVNLMGFGLYISSKKLDDLNKILFLANQSDGASKPYGLFVVFGYYLDDGGLKSYITNFENENLTAQDMLKFQANWEQGSSILNKIPLGRALTFNGDSTLVGAAGYDLTNTFRVYSDSWEPNDYAEQRGLVKVKIFLRTPPGTSLDVDFQLIAHANGESALYEAN